MLTKTHFSFSYHRIVKIYFIFSAIVLGLHTETTIAMEEQQNTVVKHVVYDPIKKEFDFTPENPDKMALAAMSPVNPVQPRSLFSRIQHKIAIKNNAQRLYEAIIKGQNAEIAQILDQHKKMFELVKKHKKLVQHFLKNQKNLQEEQNELSRELAAGEKEIEELQKKFNEPFLTPKSLARAFGAIIRRNDPRMLQKFLSAVPNSKEIDVNYTDSVKYTLLMYAVEYAVENENSSAINYLLQNNDINLTRENKDHQTALDIAMTKNNQTLLLALLSFRERQVNLLRQRHAHARKQHQTTTVTTTTTAPEIKK